MFGLKKKILGLDLGHRSLKGVLLSRRGGEVALEDYFYVDLREKLDDGLDDPDFPRLLGAVVEGRGMRNALVASAFEDRDLQVVSLSLPPIPESELRAAVLNALEAQLGQSTADLAVDFACTSPLPEGTRPGVPGASVHAYYAKIETVRSQLRVLENARLQPHSLESALHAALEAARFNGFVTDEETSLLVDVGERHTSVGLVSGGELVQINTSRLGAGDINAGLMEQLGCDYHESELRKLSYRLEKEEGQAGDDEGKTIEQGYYQIVVAIHDTVTYLRAARKTHSIKNVVLSGGGLLKDGAAALIEQSTGLPVTVLDPLRNVQIYGKGGADRERLPELAPLLHVAVGLALRGVA
jgi:type IV pilus assembly protein PilM